MKLHFAHPVFCSRTLCTVINTDATDGVDKLAADGVCVCAHTCVP